MEKLHISGTVEKIIFQSPQTWYSVCDVLLDINEVITVVGTLPYISVGEGIEATGEFITSKDYGKQFKVEEYKKFLPQSKNNILRYLSSGAVKGIGAKIAKKIVDEYGEDAFDVLENHPDWLAQINGISRKKAYEMSFDFKEKADVREIMTLSGGLISADTSAKIYKKWGKNALGMLKENPYIICGGDFGISFKHADEIAFSYGTSPENENRILSAIKYALGIYASRDGHTYVTKDLLIDSVSKLISVEKAKISPYLENERLPNGVSLIIVENEPCVVLNELYFAEINIAKRLKLLNRKAIMLDEANMDYLVCELENKDGIKYAQLQKKAIYESLKNGVFILTGGPGTGKTTVIKALLRIFSDIGLNTALCAPTGRASKRMSEATGSNAKTIHRLLEVMPGGEYSTEPKFNRNNANLLDEDVIIVDEASMVDVTLMNALLVAIKPGARLILIGDTDQLPSVGEGNVLNDIIASEEFSTVCLNEIFRQSSNSGIVTNAHKINKGIFPNLNEKYDDFFFIQVPDEKIPNYISELCQTRLPNKYGKEIVANTQIITPSKKGLCGTQSLNYVLQESLNPKHNSKNQVNKGQSKVFRVGDRVMQTKNNYSIEWTDEQNGVEILGSGVFNGDIGVIKSINDTVTIDYGGRMVEYLLSELDEVDHSYAITVHKSQGSEYPVVIIPIAQGCPYMLLTRNLIYTAITRAEKMAIIVGDKETFFKMIENNTRAVRNTMLKRLIKKDI
ncbi:MAG: ATP-dependent RecD-like DNA helicase [Clostridia bacterium]|nr:ATP-dependent RecD-like DNA helicase [Clostridia bacterium]